MWADARVTRFIGGEPRAPDVSWGKFLSSAGLWPVMGFGYWVFADRATDALVGMGGLSYFGRGIPELEGVPEAGWAFDADHWGAGYATEAMRAVLGWADAISMRAKCAASSIRAMTRRSAWRRNLGFGASARATRWGMSWRFMRGREGDSYPSPPRRRGPLSFYTAAQDKADNGPRLRGATRIPKPPRPPTSRRRR